MSEGIAHITASVIIKNGSIFKNEALIFQSDEKGGSFLRAAYENMQQDYPKFYKMDALSQLGIVAADILLKDDFDRTAYTSRETGIVLSNRNASIEADVNYLEASKDYASPALFVYTLPNIVIGEISIRYQLKGENAFFISEKFDAEWIHWYVMDLMKRKRLKACICGWVDVFYKSLDGCLFLVEPASSKTGVTFTADNLNNIYNSNYGN